MDQEEEEEELQPKATGLMLSRVDGLIDTAAPTGFINEWGDAFFVADSFYGTDDVELPAVQIHSKVVGDRILIGLSVPTETISLNFEEVKVTYDVASDGKLSTGDVRLTYNLITGEQYVEAYTDVGFTNIYQVHGLGLDQDDPKQSILRFSGVAAHLFAKDFQAEFEFDLSMYAEITGQRLTVIGSNFGRTGYSIVLISNDDNGRRAFGYPTVPIVYGDQKLTDYIVDSFFDIYFVPTPHIPPIYLIDMGIDNIEVTQTVQTYNNDLSLVRNKPTMARVYVNNPTGSPVNVEVRLTGYHEFSGGALVNKGTMTLSFTAPTSVDRTNIDDTANFLLPTSWTNHLDTQTLRLKAEVVTLFSIDSDPSDNIHIENVFFAETHNMNIYYLQVNSGTETSPQLISDTDPDFIPQALDEFRAYYPSADPNFIELDWQTIGAWSGTKDQLKDRLNELAGEIMLGALLAILLGVDPADVPFPDQVFGFTTTGSGSSTPFWGDYTLNYAAWGGLNAKRGPGVLAHEINHNLGDGNWGRHVPGCTAGGPDPNWPTSTDQTIDQLFSDTIGWHYIIDELTVDNFDFMSYCMGGSYSAGDTYPDDPSYPISWTSDYRWELLFSKLTTFTPGVPQPRYVQNLELNDLILQVQSMQSGQIDLDFTLDTTRVVSGSINVDGGGTFYPSYIVPGTFETPARNLNAPTHFVLVRYADGTEDKLPLQPTFGDFFEEGVHDPIQDQGFTFWVPDNGTIIEIQLTDANGNVLDSWKGTGYTIAATLEVPTGYKRGDTIFPKFTIDDANTNNQTVLYTQLQYSNDGYQWYNYGPQLLGTVPSFTMSRLPGGVETQLRVRVTDGFDTYYVNGQNSMSVTDLPPTLKIFSSDTLLQEEHIIKLVKGSTLSLHANGYDPETGPIDDDNAYFWTVIDTAGNILHERSGQEFQSPIFQDIAKVEVIVYDSVQNSATAAVQVQIIDPEYVTEQEYKQFLSELDQIGQTTTEGSPKDRDDTSESLGLDLPLPFNAIMLALVLIALVPKIRKNKKE